MPEKKIKPHIKTVLAIIWFAFTFSLVAWWWIFFLFKMEYARAHRMFAWEGSILLGAILIGGLALILFTYRDQKRHARLRFFFSTFSHDIKTSITRLRLQAEVLEEDLHTQSSPVLKRLLQDIQRLDLQLENSLAMANLDEGRLMTQEKISLKDILTTLRIEFSDLSIELEKDATIVGDRRALMSVFRNLLQNSVLHGKAVAVRIAIKETSQGQIEISLHDNGLGYAGPLHKLGSEILLSTDDRGNGIGLMISKKLIEKMNGELTFASKPQQGFTSTVRIAGHK